VVVRNIVASEADGVNAWQASYVRPGRATAPFCTPLCAIFRSRPPAPHVPASAVRERPSELHARADHRLQGARRSAPREDPHRLLAANCEAVCVCDLEAMLDLKQPTVSYHLKQLLNAGIVTRE